MHMSHDAKHAFFCRPSRTERRKHVGSQLCRSPDVSPATGHAWPAACTQGAPHLAAAAEVRDRAARPLWRRPRRRVRVCRHSAVRKG